MRRLTRVTLAGVLAGVMCALGSQAAFAGEAESTHYDLGVIYGYHYANFAVVGVHVSPSNDPFGATNIHASVNVPPGYMGAAPRLYFSTGMLCDGGDYIYNSSRASAQYAYTDNGADCADRSFYSQGHTHVWNGSSYQHNLTHITPSQSW